MSPDPRTDGDAGRTGQKLSDAGFRRQDAPRRRGGHVQDFPSRILLKKPPDGPFANGAARELSHGFGKEPVSTSSRHALASRCRMAFGEEPVSTSSRHALGWRFLHVQVAA